MSKKYLFCCWLVLFFMPVVKSNELGLLTYNTGLAYNFVPFAKERRPELIKALKENKSDVLCLQEVWTKKDQSDIGTILASNFPHQFVLPFNQKMSSQSPVCGVWELFKPSGLGSCLIRKCRTKKGDQLSSCVMNTCGKSLQKLNQQNPECINAILAQVGKGPVEVFLNAIMPFKKIGLFTYEGSSGLMLLSKFPIIQKKVIDLKEDSTLNYRAMMLAKIKTPLGDSWVGCTHLTADLSTGIPYMGKYSSWEEENFVQISKILSETSKLASSDHLFLLGDFNTSPAIESAHVVPSFVAAFDLFKSKGFKNHFVETNPVCSFCGSNLLNGKNLGAGNGKQSFILDHIFYQIKGQFNLSSSLHFNHAINLLSGDKIKTKTNLSDHFGVEIVLKN